MEDHDRFDKQAALNLVFDTDKYALGILYEVELNAFRQKEGA